MTRYLEGDESSYRLSLVQYPCALTIADAIRSVTGSPIRLLTEDVGYTDEAKEILKGYGFEIVGQFGAGAFAEVDENSVVFSPERHRAPVKQIIADIARPALIITTRSEIYDDFTEFGYVSDTSPLLI